MKWRLGRSRLAHGVLVTSITGILLGVLTYTVEPGRLLEAMMAARPGYLAAALAISLFFYTVQSAQMLRWTLRGFSERISFSAALVATTGNMAIRAVLPLSAGELSRAAYLHRNHGVGFVRTTIASVAMLWIKLGWLLTLSALGWALWPSGGALFGGLALVAATLVFAGGGAALWLGRRARPGDPPRWWGRIQQPLRDASAAARWRPLLVASLHCLLAVVEELVVLWLVLQAMGARVEVIQVVAVVPLCIIAAKVPLTLMGLGTREGMLLLLLHGSCTPAQLLGAGLLYSGVEHVVPALLGSLLTWPFVSRLIRGPNQR